MTAQDHSASVMFARPLLVLGAASVALLFTACSSAGGAGSASSAGASSSGAAVAAPGSRATTSPKPASGVVRVETRSGPFGTYLTDGSGRTLYMFAADGKAKSNCTGSCATYWPPFTAAGKVVAGGSAQAGDLATIPRSGGTRQVTYAGHPLYYYVGDHHAGDTAGQGSNGSGAKWWVLAPSGAPITSSGHGGGRASSSSSSSSSGGGGSWG